MGVSNTALDWTHVYDYVCELKEVGVRRLRCVRVRLGRDPEGARWNHFFTSCVVIRTADLPLGAQCCLIEYSAESGHGDADDLIHFRRRTLVLSECCRTLVEHVLTRGSPLRNEALVPMIGVILIAP